MLESEKLERIMAELSEAEKKHLLALLREEVGAHPLEEQIGLTGEAVLTAIQDLRAQGGLTWRMLRGVLAESTYGVNVLAKVADWEDVTPVGDLPFDYLISNGAIDIKIQIKLQRSVDGQAMFANRAVKGFASDMFVVETQKTRGGIDQSSGENTRPYRFGEFDILAVSMYPSTGRWNEYMYTLGRWLLPEPANANLIRKFQPVAMSPNKDWTDSLEEVIAWLLASEAGNKKISYNGSNTLFS